MYLCHDLDFSGSRKVIRHVTIRFHIYNFLSGAPIEILTNIVSDEFRDIKA